MEHEGRFGGLLAAIASVVLSLGSLAPGQDAEPDEDSPWEAVRDSRRDPDVTKEDLSWLERAAALTDEQSRGASLLYGAYVERWRSASRKLADYTEAVTGSDPERQWRDESVRALLTPVEVDYSNHTKKLTDELLEELQSLLTAEQAAHWPAFERRRRVAGQSWQLSSNGKQWVDIVTLTERVCGKAGVPEAAAAVLAAHDVEADVLLKEADAARARMRQEWAKIAADPNLDDEGRDRAYQALDEPRGEVAARAHELTDRTLQRLKPALGADTASMVEDELLERSSPYGPWMAGGATALKKVGKIETLSTEQRQQIAEAREPYLKARREALRESATLNVRGIGGEWDEESQKKWMDFYQRQTERERAIVEKLRGILTPEQREAVGPPLSESKIYFPDFDNEDEEPPVTKPSAMSRRMELMSESPEVNELDMAFLARVAGFTGEQKEAARNLLVAYGGRFRLAVRKLNAFQASLTSQYVSGGQPDAATQSRAVSLYEKYRRHKKALKAELLADLKAIVTPGQTDALERLERRLQRKGMASPQMGMMEPGSSVDVSALVDEALDKEEPSPELAAVLDRYDRELGPVADQLERTMTEMLDRYKKATEGGKEPNATEQMEMNRRAMEEFSELGESATNINLACFKQVLPLLPEDRRDAFSLAFYRAVTSSPMFDMASGRDRKDPAGFYRAAVVLEGLTPEQKEALTAEHDRFVREARDLNQKLFEAMLDAGKRATEPNMRFAEYSKPPVSELASQRSSAEQASIAKLDAILTEEQGALLPAPYTRPGVVARPDFDAD